MSSLIKHNDLYFIDSTKINVFPCAYRGYKDQANNQIIFDPESRLNTEKNLASPTGKLGYLTSYIVSSDSNTLKLNIAGYVFEISDITAADLHTSDNSPLTAAIKLTTVSLDTNEQTASTKILSSWLSEDNPALDQVDATTHKHIFTGLVFCKNVPTPTVSTEVISLSSISAKVDDTWVYNKKYNLPKIESNDSSGITIPEGDLVLSNGGLFVSKPGQNLLFSVNNDTVIVGDSTDPVLSVNTDNKALYLDGTANITGDVSAGAVETSGLTATTITAPTSAGQSRISGFKTISSDAIDGTTISGTTISGNIIIGGEVQGTRVSGTTLAGDTANIGKVAITAEGISAREADEAELTNFYLVSAETVSGYDVNCTNLTATNADINKLQITAPASSTSTDTFTIKNSSGGTETTRVKVNAKAQSSSSVLMALCSYYGSNKIYFRPDSTSTTNTNCMLEVYGSTKTNTLFIGDTNVGTKLSGIDSSITSIESRLNNLGFNSGDITNLSTSYISGGKFYKMGKMFCGQLNLTGETAYQADYPPTGIGTMPNWVNLQTDIICTFKLITAKMHDSGTDTTQITIKLSASDKAIYRKATTPGSKRDSSKLPTVVVAWYFDKNNTQHLCFAAASDTD